MRSFLGDLTVCTLCQITLTFPLTFKCYRKDRSLKKDRSLVLRKIDRFIVFGYRITSNKRRGRLSHFSDF